MPETGHHHGEQTAAGRPRPEPDGVVDRTKLLDQHDLDVSDVLYWPSVVPVHAIDDVTEPLDAYYLYYSASHSESAIRLATAPDPLGPYTDQGRIFNDPDAGAQTETPEVVWNPDTGRFHMYYHGFLETNQSTALAFSADGLRWEKHGVVIRTPPNTPGNGHTGYLRVHRIGDYWLGHHLMGGGGSGGCGVSYSADGIEWRTDPRRLSKSTDLLAGTDRRISWHHTQIVNHRGQDWWIGDVRARDAWGSIEGGYLAAAPLADERSLLAPPVALIEPDTPWEGDQVYTPDVLQAEEATYVFYATLSGSTHGEGEDPTDGHIGGARLRWTDGSEVRH